MRCGASRLLQRGTTRTLGDKAWGWGSIDHPIVAGIAALFALPLAWFVFRSVYGSVNEELDEVAASPNLGLFSWVPDWVGIKLIWVLAGVTAMTVAFYKLLVYLGALLGFVA